MDNLTEDQNQFLTEAFNFLRYVEEITKGQNKMLVVGAVEGELICSNVLLSNNVMLSMLSELVKSSFAKEYMEKLKVNDEERTLN